MRVPGLKTARLASRWLRARIAGGALILGYHRVAETVDDPFNLCVTPQHLTEHLDVLRRIAQPVALATLMAGLRDGILPRRAVAVTFDDGYADLLQNARPLLEQYETPATAFVVSGNLGRPFWWDELATGLRAGGSTRRVEVTVSGQRHEWNLATTETFRTGTSRKRVIDSVHRLLGSLPEGTRRQVLDELAAQLPAWAGEDPLPCALMPDEVIRLAEGGLVEIGSHSVSHAALAALPPHEEQVEVQHSKLRLEEIVGQTVRSFSYPHGSLSRRTQVTVRRAGYEHACASFNDLARTTTDPFHLPRFWVPDVNGDTFARWVRTWVQP